MAAACGLHFVESAAIFDRHDFAEFWIERLPLVEDFGCDGGAGKVGVPLYQMMQPVRIERGEVGHDVHQPVRFKIARVMEDARVDVLFVRHRLELDHGEVAPRFECAVIVDHIGDAARHARREIASSAAEHHHDAARHVFAAMVAGALDHRKGARVAHREALAGHAAEIALAFDGAVENSIADNDGLLGYDGRGGWRTHDDAAARQTLADVVVGVALEFERDPAREKGAEALPGSAGELRHDRVVRQPLMTVALGDFAGQHGAGGAVDISDRQSDAHRRAALKRRLRLRDQLAIDDVVDLMILPLAIEYRDARWRVRLGEQLGEDRGRFALPCATSLR